MHRRSQGNQNLIAFNPEIEAAARKRGGEARRRKRAVVAMAQIIGCCGTMPYRRH